MSFFLTHHREPSLNGDPNERHLAVSLNGYRTRLRERVIQYDDVGLLAEKAPEVPENNKPARTAITNLADILKTDKHGLLAGLDSPILTLKHVAAPNLPSTNKPEEIGSRKPCSDFALYEKTFQDIQNQITAKQATISRFSSEVQVSVGHFYILNGLLCYVAEILDERKDEVAKNVYSRDNPRLRVIFSNGTEVNILKRSLARELYEDSLGRIVIPSGDTIDILMPEEEKKGLETGCVYILSSGTKAPALSEMKRRGMLHKIGFSTQDVVQRIRNAEKDPTYLEAPVKIEANIRCYNLDPRKMEALIHAFLINQRINMTLYTKAGKPYTPREWYNVDLETALAVAKHIADGTIMQYRMDNTTNKIRKIQEN